MCNMCSVKGASNFGAFKCAPKGDLGSLEDFGNTTMSAADLQCYLSVLNSGFDDLQLHDGSTYKLRLNSRMIDSLRGSSCPVSRIKLDQSFVECFSHYCFERFNIAMYLRLVVFSDLDAGYKVLASVDSSRNNSLPNLDPSYIKTSFFKHLSQLVTRAHVEAISLDSVCQYVQNDVMSDIFKHCSHRTAEVEKGFCRFEVLYAYGLALGLYGEAVDSKFSASPFFEPSLEMRSLRDLLIHNKSMIHNFLDEIKRALAPLKIFPESLFDMTLCGAVDELSCAMNALYGLNDENIWTISNLLCRLKFLLNQSPDRTFPNNIETCLRIFKRLTLILLLLKLLFSSCYFDISVVSERRVRNKAKRDILAILKSTNASLAFYTRKLLEQANSRVSSTAVISSDYLNNMLVAAFSPYDCQQIRLVVSFISADGTACFYRTIDSIQESLARCSTCDPIFATQIANFSYNVFDPMAKNLCLVRDQIEYFIAISNRDATGLDLCQSPDISSICKRFELLKLINGFVSKVNSDADPVLVIDWAALWGESQTGARTEVDQFLDRVKNAACLHRRLNSSRKERRLKSSSASSFDMEAEVRDLAQEYGLTELSLYTTTSNINSSHDVDELNSLVSSMKQMRATRNLQERQQIVHSLSSLRTKVDKAQKQLEALEGKILASISNADELSGRFLELTRKISFVQALSSSLFSILQALGT